MRSTINLFDVIAILAVAAFIGNMVGYYIGYGRPAR